MLCVLLHFLMRPANGSLRYFYPILGCLLLPLPYDVRAWLLLVLVLVLVWLVLLLLLTLLALRRQQGLMLGQMGLVSSVFVKLSFGRLQSHLQLCLWLLLGLLLQHPQQSASDSDLLGVVFV